MSAVFDTYSVERSSQRVGQVEFSFCCGTVLNSRLNLAFIPQNHGYTKLRVREDTFLHGKSLSKMRWLVG